MKTLKFSGSPVLKIAVQPKNAANLPSLLKGLKQLASYDPLITCLTEETGDHVIAGSGENHLEYSFYVL